MAEVFNVDQTGKKKDARTLRGLWYVLVKPILSRIGILYKRTKGGKLGPHYPWIIIFTEKDTIYPVIENIASVYGVSSLSGGGEPSAACTENLIKEIQATDEYGDEIVLIGLTDYDPHGYFIYNAQCKQIRDLFPDIALSECRIGLTPDQLTPEQLELKAYQPSNKGLDKWFEITGGINGQKLGLELDALPMQQIRGMFATAIEDAIDLERVGPT
jgi:hypothetical protein